MDADKFETLKKSHAAYKGHFNTVLKSFQKLLDVKPYPSRTAIENVYLKVQQRIESVLTSAETLSSYVQPFIPSEDFPSLDKELVSINTYVDHILDEQCRVESLYTTFLQNSDATPKMDSSALLSPKSPALSETKSSIRLSALEPPSWNGFKADFYTWKRKFVHIMSEAKMFDELTQLCYLQNPKVLPSNYLSCITDCCSLNEAWIRLEERVPKETIKYEIISQLRKVKALPEKKTPAMLREFANEISLFCRRMADIGYTKDTYTCIVMQDIYERLDLDTTLRYRSRVELKKELGSAPYSVEDLEGLSNFLRSEATTLELSSGLSNLGPNPSKRFNILQNSVKENESESKCSFGCDNLHKLIDCEKYKSIPVDKRIEFIRNFSRCFVCLGLNHRALNCSKRETWSCRFCLQNNHHWTLCRKDSGKSTTFNAESPTFHPKTNSQENSGTIPQIEVKKTVGALANNLYPGLNSITSYCESNINMDQEYSAIVMLNVKNRGGEWIKARCFLDTGSNSTLVRSKFAESLQLFGNGVTSVEFGTAGGGIHKERSQEYEIQVRPLESSEIYVISALGMKKPCFDVKPITKEIFSKHEHLKEFEGRVHIDGGEIDILIGLEYAPLIIPERVVRARNTPDECPSVAITRLGCYVYGGLLKSSIRHVNKIMKVNYLSKFEEDDLNSFFYCDILGVRPTSLCVCSESEITESAFIKHIKHTTTIDESGRVCIEMPWKPGFPIKLPNNFHAAVGRMVKRENQLAKSGKLSLYNDEIRSLVNRNVVRILSPDEVKMAPIEPSWYLNHIMIERPEKESSKLRIVFDSAACYNGVCLNDAFEKGPDFTNSLFRCFLEWRVNQIAVTGDMEKMFNQISMAEKDQKYHRFLWRDGDTSSPTIVYQWLRIMFGDKPSPDIATYAIRFLAEKNKEEFPDGANILKNNTYIDDILFSVLEVLKAKLCISDVNQLLTHGKFSIKKWNSNCSSIDQNCDESTTDILGHCWNKREDEFCLKHRCLSIEKEMDFTKRNLVGLVAKLWDPFGFLLPVTIKYRIHLQKIWKAGYHWDQCISSDLIGDWKNNILEMRKLNNISLKRCLTPPNVTGPAQLHAFSDGGNEAYGTCVFLRWPTESGVVLKFVAAKAFVAPLKYKTTPRLELMAVIAMARLMKEIEISLGCVIESRHFWIDSQVVIFWLLSPSNRYKPFVACRVQEFQDSFDNYKNEVKYVPSIHNPADSLTKPIQIEKLMSWLNGEFCEFLRTDEQFWPSTSAFECLNLESMEMKSLLEEKLEGHSKSRKKKRIGAIMKNIKSIDSIQLGYDLSDYFISWEKILFSLTYMTKFLENRSFKCDFILNYSDISCAESKLFFISQESLRINIDYMKKRFVKFNPIFDDKGLIRAKGRLEKSQIPENLKYPILLSTDHPLVHLYAEYYHKRLLHQGYRVILSYIISQGVFIVGGKELLKSISSKCIFCRIRRRKLLQQQMGVLPSFRFKEHKAPFTSVAIDFFGFFKIKQSRNVFQNGSILLVTCTTTRCIHLELCCTIDTDSFLRAWRRFVSKRGVHPQFVFSDGGSSFKCASTPLKDWIHSWDKELIRIEFYRSEFNFEWNFNVPTASHMNGVAESLINSVRKGLDAAIINYTCRCLSFEEWETVISEITYVINSRPLFPDGDPYDFNCITANDILHPYGQSIVPQPPHSEDCSPRDILGIVQKKIDEFWFTWLRHLPPQLNCRNKWYHPRDNIRKGDYVIILESGVKNKPLPRCLWKKAIVVDTAPGSDGLVRSVKIRDSSQREYSRPIHKLCLIATREELEYGL